MRVKPSAIKEPRDVWGGTHDKAVIASLGELRQPDGSKVEQFGKLAHEEAKRWIEEGK